MDDPGMDISKGHDDETSEFDEFIDYLDAMNVHDPSELHERLRIISTSLGYERVQDFLLAFSLRRLFADLWWTTRDHDRGRDRPDRFAWESLLDKSYHYSSNLLPAHRRYGTFVQKLARYWKSNELECLECQTTERGRRQSE